MGGGGCPYRGVVSIEEVSKHCFSLIWYGFCGSNALYLASISFRMIIIITVIIIIIITIIIMIIIIII